MLCPHVFTFLMNLTVHCCLKVMTRTVHFPHISADSRVSHHCLSSPLPGPLHLSGGDRGGIHPVRGDHQLPQQPGHLPRERPRLAKGGALQPRHAAHTEAHDRRRHGRIQNHNALQTPPQLQSHQGQTDLRRRGGLNACGGFQATAVGCRLEMLSWPHTRRLTRLGQLLKTWEATDIRTVLTVNSFNTLDYLCGIGDRARPNDPTVVIPQDLQDAWIIKCNVSRKTTLSLLKEMVFLTLLTGSD